MNIDECLINADTYLENAQTKINDLDYNTAMASLAKAYALIRLAMDLVGQMQHEASPPEHPDWEDVT